MEGKCKFCMAVSLKKVSLLTRVTKESKKQKFNDEIEKELILIENEIKDLKKSSVLNINRIATETTTEIIKQIFNSEINKSSVSAIVNDVTKRQMEKHI